LNKGTHLDNEDALDALHDDIVERLKLTVKASTWNRCKKEFVENIKFSLVQSTNLPAVIEKITDSEDEWGLLDYREKFDENIALFITSIGEIVKNTNLHSERINQRTTQITALVGNPFSTQQAKAIMMATANDMNQFSNSIDIEEVNLKNFFSRAIEYAIKIQTIGDVDQQILKENRNAIQELINATLELKDTMTTSKNALLALPKMEMTQNKAVRRLSRCHDKLIDVFDLCITKANELLKA
jgi:CRISPR/Cas system CSM-associated protein Csm2 small subunit